MSSTRQKTFRTLVVAALATVLMAWFPGVARAATSTLKLSPDATYQTNGKVSDIVVVGTTAYLAGSFTAVRPAGTAAGDPGEQPRAYLAAVDTSTGQLLPWAPALNAPATTLAASPYGGTIYVGGSFTTVNGVRRAHLAAVDAASGQATSFRADANRAVLSLAVTSDRVYAGGAFTKLAGQVRNRVGAVTPQGALVDTWAPPVDDGQVLSLAPSADGASVYVGGSFTSVAGSTAQKNLAKLSTADGSAQAWNSHPAYPVWDIVLSGDRVYVGGNGIGGHAASYSTAGNRSWVTQTDGGVQAIALMNGVLYIGGHFDNVCLGDNAGATKGFNCPQSSATRHKLLAVDATTGATDAWAPDANSALGVLALTAASGTLEVGGNFTAIGRHPRLQQQGFAQFS